MIAIDSTSLRNNSTLPLLPGSIECSFLEEVTGADFLISIGQYPLRNRALLRKHIESGALLVQHKSGTTGDLLNSLGERLDESQARMTHLLRQINRRNTQCILLKTGLYDKSSDGRVVL
ncbi:MAG: hypothetical protein MN733_27770, partial [Nitrososphaera sp.]|nr:hypothetical protein [Nitrososphaera sp.]